MNKFTTPLILFFIFIIFTKFSCKSDENASISPNKTKVEIDENPDSKYEIQNYNVPLKVNYVNNKNSFALDNFYPIGWSKDGKFAYLHEPYDEATGYYFLTFAIQDMNTNEIVWSNIIDEKDALEGVKLIDVWGKNKEKFVKELNKNKIYQDKNIIINNFPISFNNKQLQIKQNLSYEKDPAWGFEVISDAKFSFRTKSNEEKQFYSEKFRNSYILNLNSSSYIKNPNSNTIAVLIIAEERGFEGPPNVLRLNIAGFDLNNF